MPDEREPTEAERKLAQKIVATVLRKARCAAHAAANLGPADDAVVSHLRDYLARHRPPPVDFEGMAKAVLQHMQDQGLAPRAVPYPGCDVADIARVLREAAGAAAAIDGGPLLELAPVNIRVASDEGVTLWRPGPSPMDNATLIGRGPTLAAAVKAAISGKEGK